MRSFISTLSNILSRRTLRGYSNRPRTIVRRQNQFRPRLEAMDERIVPSVDYVGATNGSWDTASNWWDNVTHTSHVPATTDDVTVGGETVNLNATARTVNTIN